MADVDLQSVTKSFGDNEVIHGVDLRVEDNEFMVFVGPSGCGKSTLLRLIAGLEDVNQGEISIGGDRVEHLPPAKRGIAMVFQSYALYPHMTVFENMSFGLRLAKAKKEFIQQRVEEAADVLQITELLQRKPKELSGGQRQRVAIGRAIVREPKVFLFDEPLSNLDAKLRVQMRIELTKLHRKLNATMIYVTHDQVEAMTMADKIVVLRDGYVEQIGRPLDLYHRPANLFVAGFIGSPAMNFLNGKISGVSDNSLEVELQGDQKIKVPCTPNDDVQTGAPVNFGIRPEHLDPEGSGDAQISAKVFAVERLGGETYLYVNTRDGSELTVHAPGDKVVSEGEEISVGLSSQNSHVFSEQGAAFVRLEV
jgi:multiple sugar transport system ATP-binding protein